MVQNSASRQVAFWPDFCIASSKRSLPITVRLIAFQKRDGNTYIQYLLTILATISLDPRPPSFRGWPEVEARPLCAIQCLTSRRSANNDVQSRKVASYNSKSNMRGLDNL